MLRLGRIATVSVVVLSVVSLSDSRQHPFMEKDTDHRTPETAGSLIAETEPNDDCASADVLFTTQAMEATIATGTDEDFFHFVITVPGVYAIETSSRNWPHDLIDSRMWLMSSDCSDTLAQDNDSGEGFYSRIVRSFDESGVDYSVRITPYDTSGYFTGDYYLTIGLVSEEPDCEPVDDEPANDICGLTPHNMICTRDSIPLSFYSGEDTDWVRFTIGEAKKVSTWTGPCGGHSTDTRICLWGGDCVRVIECNDDGPPNNAPFSGIGWPCQEEGVLLDSGTYYVEVTSSSSPIGNYYLFLDCCDTTDCPPESVEAELFLDYDSADYEFEYPYDQDWFVYNATAGSRALMYLAPAQAGYLDTKMSLYNADCELLQENDDGGPWGAYPYYMSGIGPVTFPYTGAYYIMAEASPDWCPGCTGYYAMVLTHCGGWGCPPPSHPDWLEDEDRDPPMWRDIACGDTMCGNLDGPYGMDWDLYAFETTEWSFMAFDVYANGTPGWPPYTFGCDPHLSLGWYDVDSGEFHSDFENEDNLGPPGPWGYDSRIRTLCWPMSTQNPTGLWWVLVRDNRGTMGPYVLTTECYPCSTDAIFLRGDVNADRTVDVSDYLCLTECLDSLSEGGAICADAADVNDDGLVSEADALHLFEFLRADGNPPPSEPYPDCGDDVTADSIYCLLHPCCYGQLSTGHGGSMGVADIQAYPSQKGQFFVTGSNSDTIAAFQVCMSFDTTILEIDSISLHGCVENSPDNLLVNISNSEGWFTAITILDTSFLPFDDQPLVNVWFSAVGSSLQSGILDLADSTQTVGRCRLRCSYTEASTFRSLWPTVSDGSVFIVAPAFVRGDCDTTEGISIGDAVYLLRCLYVPGKECPSCWDAADVDDAGNLDWPMMSDAMYLLKYLYVPGAPEPPAPFPDCGVDPTDDDMTCGSHPCMDRGMVPVKDVESNHQIPFR
jgi:hypothetical protein